MRTLGGDIIADPYCAKSASGTLCACVALTLLFIPAPAYAFMPHEYTGIYVHQAAHIFLTLSLSTFVLRAQYTNFKNKAAWNKIIFGTWLLIIWSLTTMAGHFLELVVTKDSMIMEPGANTPSLVLRSSLEVIFYILKMDHLLSVPAMLYFFAGLRVLCKSSQPLSKV